jgi:hypothetical protein
MATVTTHIPPILFAQRQDSCYVTIDLPDVTDEVISIEDDKINFA